MVVCAGWRLVLPLKQRQTQLNNERGKKTYNTKDSLVVTDPTTTLALTSLFKGERTGSQVL